MSYETEVLTEKKYVPNVVIYFKGVYWGIRQPDSGLTIHADRQSLEQVAINPTKVDPAKANTTINSYTFSLVDKNYAVTLLFDGITKFFQNEPVRIFIGRSGTGMPFADYSELPLTYVKGVSRSKNAYNFKTTEAKDRINRPAFNTKIKLEVNIVALTSIIDSDGTIDPAIWPQNGLIKINDEFISYASLDLVNNRFSGCVRGEKNSIPASHGQGDTIYLVTEVEANPIDILLQCLISKGGTGDYDVLPDGAGLDESLINVDRFLEIKEEFFDTQTYTLLLYGVENILKYLETEILFPNELRIISDNTSKISLSILNRRVFDDKIQTFDDSCIKAQPSYEVDDTEIVNVVSVEYDFSEGTGTYRKLIMLEDADSITDFGKRATKEIKLKGVQENLGGAEIAQNIAERFLTRFAYPKPEISFTAHMNRSLIQLGEKSIVQTSTLPNVDTGELNFADTLEVLERGINWKTGDVKFKMGFTSFTGLRECFLAPSDSILEFITASQIRVGAGRGALYTVGWKMRIYNDSARDYVNSDVITITEIDGDLITFAADINTTVGDEMIGTEDGFSLLQQNGDFLLLSVLLNNTFRIMFADYDDVTTKQKLYCFINQAGLSFNDNQKPYQVSL